MTVENADARPELDWLSSCRPFFTSFSLTDQITDEVIRDTVGAAKSAGCDVLMCFVESEGLPLWRSDLLPTLPAVGEGDAVQALVTAAHEAGLRFVAQWMGVHCQSHQLVQHPSWRQRDGYGEPNAAMCLNSPFGSLLLAQVAEVVSRYQVDGVYFDGLYARLGGCYCQYCESKFRELHGVGMPRPEGGAPAPDRSGSEHWLSFSNPPQDTGPRQHDFRFSTVEDFAAQVRAVLDSERPSTAFVIDTLGVRGSYHVNAQDLVRLSEWIDAFLIEAYWDALKEPVDHVGLEAALVGAETGRPVWWPRWLARHPDGNQVSVPEATVNVWAGQALVHGAMPVAVEQSLYAVDQTLAPAVREAMAATKRFQDLTADARPIAEVVLLHSVRTKEAFGRHGRREDSYFDAFSGAYKALTEAHIPFEVVTEARLDEALGREASRALVIPNAVALDEEDASTVRRFLARGGGVVATYRPGFEAGGSVRRQSALQDVLGCTTLGLAVRDGATGPEFQGGREPTNYYRTSVDSDVLGPDLRGRLFSFNGAHLRVRPHQGMSVVATVLDSDYSIMDGSRFFAWRPGKPTWPLMLAGERGGGRVVYFTAPLDAVFHRQGWPEAAGLLQAGVRWAAGDGARPAVEVDTLPCVDARSYRLGGSDLLIVLANRATNNLYAIGADVHRTPGLDGSLSQHVRYTIPIPGVRVRLEGAGRAAPAVEALCGGDVEVAAADGRVEVTLSRLNAYEILVVRR